MWQPDPYKAASRLWNAGKDLFTRRDDANTFGTAAYAQKGGVTQWNPQGIMSQGIPGVNMTMAPTVQKSTTGIIQPTYKAPLGTTRTAPKGNILGVNDMSSQFLRDREAQNSIAKAATKTESDKLIAERKGRISEAWKPVQGMYDERLSSLPGERTAMEDQLNNSVAGQLSGINSQRDQAIAGLDQQKTAREQDAKKGFRALEEDVRNQLDAYSQKLGVMGASDSSASGQVAGAIGKQALRGRGDIIDTRTQAFQEIDFKIADTRSKADQAINEIETSKRNQLFEIGTYFSDRISQLKEAKANASAQESTAIDNMIADQENQFIERARGLDDEVRNYKASIGQWQLEREAAFEDYKRQLTESAKFDSTPYAQATNAALGNFNQILSGGGVLQPLNTAQNNNLYGYEATSTDEDPLKKLLNQTI